MAQVGFLSSPAFLFQENNWKGYKGSSNSSSSSGQEGVLQELLQAIQDLRKDLNRLQQKADAAEAADLLMLEWEFLANICDRLSIIFFFVSILIITTVFLSIGLLSFSEANRRGRLPYRREVVTFI